MIAVAPGDRGGQSVGGLGRHRVQAGVLDDVGRALQLAAGHRHQPHARHAVGDLVGKALGHEPGADDPDPDGRPGCLELAQRGVDEDHRQPAAIRAWTSRSTSASSPRP